MPESVLTHSPGEGGSQAHSSKAKSHYVPQCFPRRARAGWVRRAAQSPQPWHPRRPRQSSHQMVSLPLWLGGRKDGGSTGCSPGVTDPATCKLRVTQPPPPPPPHTSSYLKHCLSSIALSYFPRGS